MRLSRFNIAMLAIFIVFIGGILSTQHLIERRSMLTFLSKQINQGVYYLQKPIVSILSEDRDNNIQSLLEQYALINPAINSISLSLDGKILKYSTIKTLQNSIVSKKFEPISNISDAILDKKLDYVSEFNYYINGKKYAAWLYIELQNDYIFSYFAQIVLYYDATLFLLLVLIASVSIYFVRYYIIKPLEFISTQMYQDNPVAQKHIISEFNKLDNSICDSLRSLKQKQQELKRALSIDNLTNLPNRYSLQEEIKKHPIASLAIINIDRFADINEVYGNDVGDKMLVLYATWLRDELGDCAIAQLFKLHGDQYAILCTLVDSKIFQEKLHNIIEKTKITHFKIDDIDILLTVSIGLALTSERLLEHTIIALKRAKQSHKSFNIFTSSISNEQEANISWYKKLKDAIDKDQIKSYYQPIVDNTTQKIVKYEALIRLVDTQKVFSPFEFLDIAKKTKLSLELSRIVFDQMVDNILKYKINISMNLSTSDILDDFLIEHMHSTITKHLIGHHISFEILESEGIENYKSISSFIEKFQRIGCSFSIDDFGSGYSNFEHLLKLNVDTIKIDGSFIKNIIHDRNAQFLVKHMSSFARDMNIKTVAEFVASEEIYEMVKKLGVDMSQGYHFYKPSADIITS